MIKLQRALPRSAIFALGLCVGITLVILPLANKISTSTIAQHDQYGEALVKSAAREAVEAAFRQDLISLSAIIEAVASNPGVQQAAIHNVEGRILVQAGKDLNHLPENLNTFQSTISLQDSVAGVVTVSIAPPPWQATLYLPIYLAMLLGCAAYILWTIYYFRVFRFELPAILSSSSLLDKNDTSDIATPPATPDTEKTDADTKEANQPHQQSAYATLCVKNVGVLQQQLNGETFRLTFRQLEQKLNSIGQLYGAVECHWERDRYYLQFGANQAVDALFNAACAARLMLDLTGITNRIPLDLSAQISFEKENTLNDSMPFVGLAVHQAGDAFESMIERVELLEISEEDESRRLISEFYQPYAELLKKQTSQLNEQF